MSGGRPLLEVCVDEPMSVTAAIAGGADRLELCSALALGGLSPSMALARATMEVARPAGVVVHAMVRPRAGDFAYDEAELALAIADAATLIEMGVDGLVFGAARGGVLDRPALARWVAAVRSIAPDVPLVLHRAIDTVADPVAAVGQARGLGFATILTSGGAPRAIDGVATVARMVAAAHDMTIMAGAGVTPDTVPALLAAGAGAVHASAGVAFPTVEPAVSALGFDDPPRRCADATVVRALRAALDDCRTFR